MYVYILRAGNRGAIKIGVARNIGRRIDTLQVGNAFKLNLLAAIPCANRKMALDIERRIHARFEKQRIRGEWFTGNIELRRIKEIRDDKADIHRSLKRGQQ